MIAWSQVMLVLTDTFVSVILDAQLLFDVQPITATVRLPSIRRL